MLLLLFSLPACDMVNEPVNPPVVEDEENPNLYVTLTLTLPNQASETRAPSTNGDGSSTDGTLPGRTNENKLNSARLLLYDTATGNIIYEPTQEKVLDTSTKDINKYWIIYKLPIEAIKTFNGKTYGLAIVGNEGTGTNESGMTHNLGIGDGKAGMKDAYFSVTSETKPIVDFGTGSTSQGQIMLLVNKAEVPIRFPSFDTDASNSQILRDLVEKGRFPEIMENTFQICHDEIELERAVARIDYADGSDTKDFTYTITSTVPTNGTEFGVKIKLAKMQVFNVSPKSYLFRHTAEGDATGITSSTVNLFGDENGKTVENPNKETYTWIVSPELGHGEILNPLNSKDLLVSGTEGKIPTSDLNSNRYKYPARGKYYYPWCYVSENTLSGYENLNKDKVPQNATGILFSFEVLGSDGKALEYSQDKSKYPIGVTNSITENAAEKTITITDQEGYWIDVAPTEGHYYLKYYAFLKHNNPNTAPEVLDPMEYAVVRNNVYQVSVTAVKKLFNPEAPLDYYLSLDIKVLAWAKRDISVTW